MSTVRKQCAVKATDLLAGRRRRPRAAFCRVAVEDDPFMWVIIGLRVRLFSLHLRALTAKHLYFTSVHVSADTAAEVKASSSPTGAALGA